MNLLPMNFSPTEFYIAGGTLPPGSPSYIVRAADEALYNGLTAGRFCYVLTSRQMGKSSLMHQTARQLKADGRAVATVDLSKLGANITLEQWYYGLLRGIGKQLCLQAALTDWWQQNLALSPLQRLFTALDEQVTPDLPSGLILFIDEIDTVRRLPFSADEFFAAIRERHNARATGEETDGITFCLLGVASPGDLILDPRTTPFNIGLRIELTDFTPAEAAPLAAGLAAGFPAKHPCGETSQIPGVENTRLSGLRPSVLRTREAVAKLRKNYMRMLSLTPTKRGKGLAFVPICPICFPVCFIGPAALPI